MHHDLGEIAMIGREEFCKQFGKLLAQRRIEAKMSQRDVANALGLSRASIANIERGRQSVSLHMVYLIADALERELVELLPLHRANVRHPHQSGRASHLGAHDREQLERLSPKEASWLNRIARTGSRRI
jgi:transcriptional regulator with XRE-family HTH domain